MKGKYVGAKRSKYDFLKVLLLKHNARAFAKVVRERPLVAYKVIESHRIIAGLFLREVCLQE